MKLVIEPNGIIHQECFCRCETLEGRFHGYCKDYKSRGNTLTKTIVDMLFPPETKKFLFKLPKAKKKKVDT